MTDTPPKGNEPTPADGTHDAPAQSHALSGRQFKAKTKNALAGSVTKGISDAIDIGFMNMGMSGNRVGVPQALDHPWGQYNPQAPHLFQGRLDIFKDKPGAVVEESGGIPDYTPPPAPNPFEGMPAAPDNSNSGAVNPFSSRNPTWRPSTDRPQGSGTPYNPPPPPNPFDGYKAPDTTPSSTPAHRPGWPKLSPRTSTTRRSPRPGWKAL